ncbi:MAG: DUF481 domain-containing protein [Alphaproteobacteria bacterium]|nr:DUF481 domain-containing protein [Alphaproteobacteria bacterium]
MSRKTCFLTVCASALVVLSAGPALAGPLPAGVAEMIRTAAAAKDPSVLAAVVRVAKQANPDCAAQIDALAAQGAGAPPVKALRIAAEPTQVGAPAPAAATAAGWKGSAELGGGLSTGATQSASSYGALDLTRALGRWRQRLVARGDYQKTDGETSNERLSVAYEPRLDLSRATYAFGLTQYEHDRIQGYSSRYTVGAGMGLQIAKAPGLKVALDFGPALRVTHHDTSGQDTTLAARGSMSLHWLPSDRVTVSEESALYADDGQTSARSLTSLDTALFGPLKARLSYDMHYEKNPTVLGPKLATTTRASLVYSF